jgi:hypothetical protein
MVAQLIALGPEFDTFQDDTEESVVGSSLHQAAITSLYGSLILCGPHRGLPWFIGNQTEIIIPRQGNMRSAKASPDICVHPTLTNASRTSLILASDGPPVLAINDINLVDPKGKPSVYQAIGITEYLVFDPTGAILGTPVWARRAGASGFTPWEPTPDGRWTSAALGVSFEPQGLFLRVYDQDGALVPVVTEFVDIIAERTRQLEERDRQLGERDRRLAELEAEMRALRGDE